MPSDTDIDLPMFLHTIIMIQIERSKERRYYPALQKLREELNMEAFKENKN